MPLRFCFGATWVPGVALLPGRQPAAAPAWQSEKYKTCPVDEEALNAAVALRAAVIETVQLAVPLQAPLQPVKVCPAAGVAVSVTLAPDAKLALQALPQLMPAGDEVMTPEPLTVVLSR